MDLGFSLCEVLHYKFDCFNGYGYLDFLFLLEVVFITLCLSKFVSISSML